MQIKILSDGQPLGTKIIDSNSGEDLSRGIRAVNFEHAAGEEPRATIECVALRGDFVAKVIPVVKCTVCNHNHALTDADFLRLLLVPEDEVSEQPTENGTHGK